LAAGALGPAVLFRAVGYPTVFLVEVRGMNRFLYEAKASYTFVEWNFNLVKRYRGVGLTHLLGRQG